jgi:hypothetical protein
VRLPAFAVLASLALAGAAAAEDPLPPPEMPEMPPMGSVVIKGSVAVLLPDGFLIRNDEGRYTLIETMCPAWTLGLERGDEVSVFGGVGTSGIASGAITLLLPGFELPLRDGMCERRRG